MLHTLAVTAALAFAPAQGALALSNDRLTYGELGANRPDTKLLPGDVCFISFDIDNLTIDAEGKVNYTMAMEFISNKDGKQIFKQDPVKREELMPLGGTRLPARAFVILAPDQAVGSYTCKISVVDLATKASKAVEKQIDVIAPDFGLISVVTSADMRATIPAPPVGMTGQQFWINCLAAYFARDPNTKQPSIVAELRVFDENGTPTSPKPMTIVYDKMVDEKEKVLPLQFLLPLTRAGRFTVEIKAEDKLTKKVAKITLPVIAFSLSK
jgi:hypothetical protein